MRGNAASMSGRRHLEPTFHLTPLGQVRSPPDHSANTPSRPMMIPRLSQYSRRSSTSGGSICRHDLRRTRPTQCARRKHARQWVCPASCAGLARRCTHPDFAGHEPRALSVLGDSQCTPNKQAIKIFRIHTRITKVSLTLSCALRAALTRGSSEVVIVARPRRGRRAQCAVGGDACPQ